MESETVKDADEAERIADSWFVIGRPIEAAAFMRRAVQLRKRRPLTDAQ